MVERILIYTVYICEIDKDGYTHFNNVKKGVNKC